MNASVSRIASLDALRGLAALSVLLLHYKWLAPEGARPFENSLAWVYEYGRFAVPLFYMLSGYIFFAAYATPLGERRIDGRTFFWLRASRLYPLQLLTLVIVAGLQMQALDATGAYFVHSHNDLRHFLLNLVFLQFSWFDPIMSFNGPSWSLSIEAGLYAVFFVFAQRFGAAAPAEAGHRRNLPRAIDGPLAAAAFPGRLMCFSPRGWDAFSSAVACKPSKASPIGANLGLDS